MFGFQGRIGYLCPSVFETIAYDFYRIAPPGVGLIGVTCMIEGWTRASYEKGLMRMEACATELARRRCDFVVHAGVPLVVSQQIGFEQEIIRKVSTLTNAPATTSIKAAIDALEALAIYRVGIVNPYPPELNQALVKFLTAYGFEIVSVVSLGTDFTRIGDITVADVYRAARQAAKEGGQLDGLYLPCPQFPVLDVIEAIEADLGVPAVPHLGSELWAALNSMGIKKPIKGFGRLLASL